MSPGSKEWTLERWGPTAPESRVLIDGWKRSGREAFRLAVLECVARRRLTVAERTDLPDEEAPPGLLLPGAEARPTGDRPLDALQELFGDARTRSSRGSGVGVGELTKAARRRYGSLDGYVKTEVLPALQRRGLYERRNEKLFRLLPVTRWRLTRTGEASRLQLQQNRRLGEKNFGEWVRSDPEQAYRFLGLAGSSLLLMEALHPDLKDLQEPEDDEGGFAYPVPGPAGDLGPHPLPDLGGALSASDSWSGGAGSGSGGWFGGGGGGFDGGGGGGGGF